MSTDSVLKMCRISENVDNRGWARPSNPPKSQGETLDPDTATGVNNRARARSLRGSFAGFLS